MSHVPRGWELTTIGDIADYIQRGKSPKYAESSDLPVINQKCIRWNVLETQHVKYIHPDQIGSWDEARYVRAGDILWNSTGTGTVGRAYLLKGLDCTKRRVVDSHVTIVRVNGHIDPRIVFRWVVSPAVQDRINQMCDGSTNQVELSRAKIAETSFPLPPKSEQKRISDKLDIVLARVDACRDRLASVVPLLRRFRQSVIAAATSGGLTADWRAANANGDATKELAEWLARRATFERKPPATPDMTHWTGDVPTGWVISSTHQFAVCLDRLRVPIKRENRKNAQGLYPYYGANGEVGRIDEYIFDDELVLVTEDETFYGREKPIAYRSSGKCWVNNHAHVLRAQTKTASDFLCFSLMHYDVSPWLTGTTGRAKLTQQALNSLPIAIPPQAEIDEIVRRVEVLFAFADRLEARLTQARTAVDRLTPSLLAKAFRGELVPQDPADEPAAELLKRLQCSAAEKPAAGRPRRRAVAASP